MHLKLIVHIFPVIVVILLGVLLRLSQCVPLPKVNEQQFQLSKIPQSHCLRYFKHDLLMMRRCRHLRVPTVPRIDIDKK